jgi:hypothetical protein
VRKREKGREREAEREREFLLHFCSIEIDSNRINYYLKLTKKDEATQKYLLKNLPPKRPNLAQFLSHLFIYLFQNKNKV